MAFDPPPFDLRTFAAQEYRLREAHQQQGIARGKQTRARAEQELRPWAAMALRLAAADIIKADWLFDDGTPPCWHHIYPDDRRISDISREIAIEAATAARKAVQRHRANPADHALETRAAGLIRLACHFATLGGLPTPQPFADADPERIAA
jgi:hypothetical protein